LCRLDGSSGPGSCGQARWALSCSRQITDEQAFDPLREPSQVRNQKLRDLAEDVVYTGSL
jgi:AmiR/NasT family two-component response regulator